jgi:hypothetical protein
MDELSDGVITRYVDATTMVLCTPRTFRAGIHNVGSQDAKTDAQSE